MTLSDRDIEAIGIALAGRDSEQKTILALRVKPMTAADHEAAYKAALAETERLKQQWHDALIADKFIWKCPNCGDTFEEAGLSKFCQMCYAYSGRIVYLKPVTRIDESGNSLPPRDGHLYTDTIK